VSSGETRDAGRPGGVVAFSLTIKCSLSRADGFVIIECEEPGTGHATGQVILDYLTDTVVNKKVTVRGSPLVSPDSRIVVSVDRAPDGVTLVVQQVLGNFWPSFCFCLVCLTNRLCL